MNDCMIGMKKRVDGCVNEYDAFCGNVVVVTDVY